MCYNIRCGIKRFPERSPDMTNGKTNSISMSLRFCIAGIICFTAAYLSEKTLGAVAAFPFILILPGIAHLIYPRIFHITGFCALGAFIFKCVFSASITEILLYTLFCALLGTVSALTYRSVFDAVKNKAKLSKTVISATAFIILLVIYIIFYGTIPGVISSERYNREYLEKTYPDEQFLIGNTYYSFGDKCYLTEFGFTAKERYSAFVSTGKKGDTPNPEGFAVIDGYRDHTKYEILNRGKNDITTALSTIVYEGTDYVIRNSTLNTNDVLTSGSSYGDYKDKTNYEIALYYQFGSENDFRDMCRKYTEHLDKYDSVVYQSITFYGFDTSGKKDFSYSATHIYGSGELKTQAFDSSSYIGYFHEKDTHRYWELLG